MHILADFKLTDAPLVCVCFFFTNMGASISSACLRAVNRSEGELLAVIRSTGSVLVASYLITAIASGVLYSRWRRLPKHIRLQMWLLYGKFTGLMCAGSCFGVLTWICNSFQTALAYIAPPDGDLDLRAMASIRAKSYSWWAAYFIFYVPEILCLLLAKAAVLERMAAFSSSTLELQHQRHLTRGRRVLMFVIIGGNLVGFASNIAAAVYALQSASLCHEAFDAFSEFGANSTRGMQSLALSFDTSNSAFTANGVQLVTEVSILFAIIFAFAVLGALSLRRFSHAGAVTPPSPPSPKARLTCSTSMCLVAARAFVGYALLLRARFC